jgi:3-methyladenine DNA glycosylase AlkD
LKDKVATDAQLLRCLRLIEKAADDERNFVKKGVNWALRGIGDRNLVLHEAAVAVARKLAQAPEATPRWIGKDALRQLGSAAVKRRLEKKHLLQSALVK